MQITTRNSSDDQGGLPAALVPGYYKAVIMSAAVGYPRHSEKPALSLMLDVVLEGDLHRKVEVHLWISPKALWRIEQLLAAAGWRFRGGEEINFNPGDLLNRRVGILTCRRRSNQGHLFTEVMRFMRLEDLPHEGALTEDERAYFALEADGTRAGASLPANQAAAAPMQPQAPLHYQQPAGYQQPAAQSGYAGYRQPGPGGVPQAGRARNSAGDPQQGGRQQQFASGGYDRSTPAPGGPAYGSEEEDDIPF